jgi:hypothetical protein
MCKIYPKIFKKEGMVGTMDGRKGSKPSLPNWKLKHLMDSKHNKFVTCITWG